MEEQNENKTVRAEGESRIDYRIRTTRKSLNPDALYGSYHIPDSKAYAISEFSGGFSRGPVGRIFLWRLLKLMALYLAKGFMWLVRLIKRK